MKISAFVPLKLNSRRLPNKNFLRLGNKPLAGHIFDTLLTIDALDSVYCYTSQSQVLSLLSPGVKLLPRPKSLDGDSVKANELFDYAVRNIDADIIVLCHATGPYIKKESIENGLSAIIDDGHDCAFSVSRHKTYSWFHGKPLNYDPSNMAQTQNLEPVYCETSGFYIFLKSLYLESGTRIGSNPYMVPVDFKEAIDIDEPEDFMLAMHMINYVSDDIDHSAVDQVYMDIAHRKLDTANVEHVAFDFDGVLVNSLAVMENAWNFCRERFSLKQDFDEYKVHIGLPFFDILRKLEICDDMFNDIKNVYDEISMAGSKNVLLYPDVVESIFLLKSFGKKISLVTSKTKDRTLALVNELFPPQTFDCIVTPEDVGNNRGKPYPDQLLKACLGVGAEPQKSVFVGDMESDCLAAKRAGFFYISANWGYGEYSKVDFLWFNSMRDLADYFSPS